jgi:hypothetical protein
MSGAFVKERKTFYNVEKGLESFTLVENIEHKGKAK